EFGVQAEKNGVEEVCFTFEGHSIERDRGLHFLTNEELKKGEISLAYVSKLMNRSYNQGPKLKKILQSIWHQINNAEEVYVIGQILDDGTVKGGTGWGAEFAKLCNKPLCVFDQGEKEWFKWSQDRWEKVTPKINKKHFSGGGTRFLSPEGRQAIANLYAVSFKEK
ncbi:uncharacterized protein METZ01_LOCUS491970, partial [marine metagenome]